MCAEPTVRCRTVVADIVDDAVATLLQTMTPQQIQLALAGADEVADRQVRTHRAAEPTVERARYNADRAVPRRKPSPSCANTAPPTATSRSPAHRQEPALHPRHVAAVRGIYQIFTPRTLAVQDEEIGVKQAAQLLGIPADAIYNWLRHGQVPALGLAGRWYIPGTPKLRLTASRAAGTGVGSAIVK